MKIAFVLTVKNESVLLRRNLLYHRCLGAQGFYVFLDGSTDGSGETIWDLPYVQIAPSVSPERFNNRPELAEFLRLAGEHSSARMNLNTCAAMEMALSDGFDWLISLDPDELVCPDLEKGQQGQLLELFADLSPETQVLRLLTMELLQEKMEYGNVFAEATWFKRPESRLKRRIYDPLRRTYFDITGFYGQTLGKSAIRLGTLAIPRTAHKFVAYDGRPLNTVRRGWLLHYFMYSFNNFIHKFRNFELLPNTYLSGNPIEYQRRLWRDLVNRSGYSEDMLRQYYARWIMFSSKEVRRLKSDRWLGIFPRQPEVLEVRAVAQAFQNMSDIDELPEAGS